jgi:hypothetical protein
MALLFERVFLPNSLQPVVEFAKHVTFDWPSAPDLEGDFSPMFPQLTPPQLDTAKLYLGLVIGFLSVNGELFGPVFETDLVRDMKELTRGRGVTKGVPAELRLDARGTRGIDDRVALGYVPFATLPSFETTAKVRPDAAQLASLLAMRSVQMVLPALKPARPQEILEARAKLSDFLPPFWAAMLRLSVELKGRIGDGMAPAELVRESADLVETVVRPAAIELREKLEKDRRNWFHRILGPARQFIALLLGRPGLAARDLVTASLLLSTDLAATGLEQLKALGDLRRDSGLTFLLELDKQFATPAANPAARRRKRAKRR